MLAWRHWKSRLYILHHDPASAMKEIVSLDASRSAGDPVTEGDGVDL